MDGIWKMFRNSSVSALLRILMTSMGIGALTAGCASQLQQTLTANECDELSPRALLEAIENGECRAFLTKLERIWPAARSSLYTNSSNDTRNDDGRGGSSLGGPSTQAAAESRGSEPGGNDTGGNDTGGNGGQGGHGGNGGHGGGHGHCR